MKGRAGRTEHFGRNSRKALPKKDPIYNMVCLRWWKRCVRGAELGGWSWRTMESSPASWTRRGGLLLVFGGHREVGNFLSLRDGTFVPSRRDIRFFPKGRSSLLEGTIAFCHRHHNNSLAVGHGHCPVGCGRRRRVREREAEPRLRQKGNPTAKWRAKSRLKRGWKMG